MKTAKTLKRLSLISGIIVTLFYLLAFGPKVIEEFIKKGFDYLIEIPTAFFHWNESPTAFFYSYFIGYIIIWWKPLWGSVLIILASILYVILAGIDGPPILVIPAFLVGLFYLLYWNTLRT